MSPTESDTTSAMSEYNPSETSSLRKIKVIDRCSIIIIKRFIIKNYTNFEANFLKLLSFVSYVVIYFESFLKISPVNLILMSD